MKFGKLPDVSLVDFTLPADAKENESLLASLPVLDHKPTLFIGCTGWSMKEWNGKVYPKNTKTKDYLRYYAKQFNTIELNTTHYRIPTNDTIYKWFEESTADFHFCPKIPQSISHSRELGYKTGLIEAFCDATKGLREKRGCSFMQLPPYFAPDRLALLKIFLEDFPSHIPLAIEFRHESWFNNPTTFNNLANLMQEHQATMVITDVAGRRDVLHQRLTTDTAMIRFVGNDLVPSDFKRIDDWIDRMKGWFEKGIKQIYFFTHEPDNLQAPELANYLAVEAQKKLRVITRGPDLKKYTDGDQMSLF